MNSRSRPTGPIRRRGTATAARATTQPARWILTLPLVLTSALPWADPAPFGLALGTATREQVAARYALTPAGINRINDGPMFDLDPTELDFGGLKSVTLIFGPDQVLQAVLTTLPRDRYERLFETLSSKYRLLTSEPPFAEHRYARFSDGDTEITLSAPYLSFNLELTYVQRPLSEAADRAWALEAERKREGLAGRL